MYFNIDPRVGHLTEEQIDNLISRYYAGESPKSLAQEFKIDCLSNQLYKLLPSLILHQMPCPHCGTPMVRKNGPRSSLSYKSSSIRCPNCHHKDDANCRCENCTNKIKQSLMCELEKRQQQINEFCIESCSDSATIGTIGNLTLQQAVSLIALIRTCLYMNTQGVDGKQTEELHLNALSQSMMKFTPGAELGLSLIKDLMGCGLISYSEHSDLNSFVFNEDELEGVNYEAVSWKIRGANIQQMIRDIERYAADQTVWPQKWRDAIDELWISA